MPQVSTLRRARIARIARAPGGEKPKPNPVALPRDSDVLHRHRRWGVRAPLHPCLAPGRRWVTELGTRRRVRGDGFTPLKSASVPGHAGVVHHLGILGSWGLGRLGS
eukprot:8183042-Pyramimonas_sp.AAC.1